MHFKYDNVYWHRFVAFALFWFVSSAQFISIQIRSNQFLLTPLSKFMLHCI